MAGRLVATVAADANGDASRDATLRVRYELGNDVRVPIGEIDLGWNASQERITNKLAEHGYTPLGYDLLVLDDGYELHIELDPGPLARVEDAVRRDEARRSVAAPRSSSELNVAELLRTAAAGRRTYARNATGVIRTTLQAEAVILDQAARVATGDLGPLYGWLPSSWWTDEMLEQMKISGEGGSSGRR